MIRIPLPKRRRPHDPLAAAAKALHTVGSTTKRKILFILARDGIGYPTLIARELGLGRAAVRAGLKDLRKAGVVEARWESYNTFRRAYVLVPTNGLAMIVQQMHNNTLSGGNRNG